MVLTYGEPDLLVNDVLGILADTYGAPEWTDKNQFLNALREINDSRKYIRDDGTVGYMFQTLWIIASVCTIPVQQRTALLEKALERQEYFMKSEKSKKILVAKQEVLENAKQKYNTQLNNATVIDPTKLRTLRNIYDGIPLLTVTCIKKVKSGNRIVAYEIKNTQGEIRTVDKEVLIDKIKGGVIKVTNLTLNGNGLY
jgi:hypothetical protein